MFVCAVMRIDCCWCAVIRIDCSRCAVMRIKNEYDVDVRVPSDAENSRVVRIEGVSEGVAQAKRELLELVDKMVRIEKKSDKLFVPLLLFFTFC